MHQKGYGKTLPFFANNTGPDSLLIMDNFSAHISDDTVKELDSHNIKHLCLAPNTTPICQPVDVGIGGTIKSKIKKYFHESLIEIWEITQDFFIYNEKKKKYKVQSPSRELIA